MGKKPGDELVRHSGLSVGGGHSSADVNITASVTPGWSDREVFSLTVLVGQPSFLNTKLLQTTHFQNF